MITENFTSVQEAFNRQSVLYDELEEDNLILKYMRERIRQHALSFLKKGDEILELNSGTGLDAIFFAKEGLKVHATDISEGMIDQLKVKVERINLQDKITIQQCSFANLHQIEGKFDYIFSNFGGLNCVRDLKIVTNFFPHLLNKNGRVTLVIMPKFCPWELALIFLGKFNTAFRRLKKEGTTAHIEGIHFKSFYFSPIDVMKALGKDFIRLKLEGLSALSPPPYMKNFPQKFPRLFEALKNIDKKYSVLPPFNKWADHFILTSKYLPK